MPGLYLMNPHAADHRALPARVFHPRSSHSKSRLGCNPCKRRRKKCDESMPTCSACSNQGFICHYSNARTLNRMGPKKSSQSPNQTVTFYGLPDLGTDEMELLDHFHSHTLCTLGSSSVQEVIESCLAAAFQFDFLRHAILGLAASHLMFLAERQDLRMYSHLDSALLTFRQRLSSPITSHQVDAILTSCVLLNTIAFSTSNHRSSKASFLTGTGDLQWLTVQVGLKTIMSDVRGLLKGTSWATVYKKENSCFQGDSRAPFDDDSIMPVDIPDDVKTLYGINEGSTSRQNPYYLVLRSLVPLLTSDPLDTSLTQLMTVVHRFKPEFYELLRSKDLRALLLLAQWLGLMCKVNLWWVSSRARSECVACCKYLDASGDETIRRFLSLPAACCGHQLGQTEAQGTLGRVTTRSSVNSQRSELHRASKEQTPKEGR